LLDLLAQILRRSLVTGLELARASLTPRLAQASAWQSLPSQLNLETAVEEGFRARKWPSHQGKEALLDEF
jgi:hypothetical protein